MIKFIPILISLSFMMSCKTDYKDTNKYNTTNNGIMKDTTPKVTGVGGVFFFPTTPQN